jgi:hypothetical protein
MRRQDAKLGQSPREPDVSKRRSVTTSSSTTAASLHRHLLRLLHHIHRHLQGVADVRRDLNEQLLGLLRQRLVHKDSAPDKYGTRKLECLVDGPSSRLALSLQKSAGSPASPPQHRGLLCCPVLCCAVL